MVVEMVGLYGDPERKAWYRKEGDCFNFVNDRSLATEIDVDEANEFVLNSDYYLKQFNASDIYVLLEPNGHEVDTLSSKNDELILQACKQFAENLKRQFRYSPKSHWSLLEAWDEIDIAVAAIEKRYR